MILERKKNTIRNSFWGLISKIINIIAPFVLRTIMIQVLGFEYLGLSSLFTSILQVLNMAELGFSSAIAYSLYKPIAENDNKTICAIIHLFKKVYFIIGTIIFVIGIALIPFLKYFIHGNVPSEINIYILYLLYLFNTGISYYLFAYKSAILSAMQREDIISRVYSFVILIQYIIQISVLITIKNYYIYYIFVPFFTIVNNIVIAAISSKRYPQYIPRGDISRELLEDIKKKVSGLVVSKICGTTRNTFDSIIISSFLGLSIVGIYSNYYYILSNIAAVLTIVVTSMRAGIGNSIVMESKKKNYNDFIKFTFIYEWISGWCSICLLCLYQPFMILWVGKKYLFSFNIVVLFCLYFFWLTMADMINVYSGAVGLWYENRNRTLVEAIANLILNVLLGYKFGVVGIMSATLITIVLFNFGWQALILFKNYFSSVEINTYFKICLKYNFFTIINGAITLFVCIKLPVSGMLSLIFRGLTCLILPNILYLLFYKKSTEFQSAKVFVKGCLHL